VEVITLINRKFGWIRHDGGGGVVIQNIVKLNRIGIYIILTTGTTSFNFNHRLRERKIV